jgi:hypothetical protein
VKVDYCELREHCNQIVKPKTFIFEGRNGRWRHKETCGDCAARYTDLTFGLNHSGLSGFLFRLFTSAKSPKTVCDKCFNPPKKRYRIERERRSWVVCSFCLFEDPKDKKEAI